MQRAIELAKNAWGHTHPNPMVGAVIVESGTIVAEGWHVAAGQAHAEVAAIKTLGRTPAPDATMYVTLEPCSTTGRTGACTEAISKFGIRKVVVGATDPNPAHAGRGLEVLRSSGVEVISGICETECEDLNLIFNHWIVTGRPLIAGKIATTIDGKVATRTGHSQWITGPLARADVHRWRQLFPAIGCGSGTVLADNPSLTVRLEGQEESSPRRFIFDRSLGGIRQLEARVFDDDFLEKTTVVTWEAAAPERLARLKKKGLNVWSLPPEDDTAFFENFAQTCAENSIYGVLVEGGPRLLSAMFKAKAIDYLFAYRAPKLLADDDAASCLTGQNIHRMDHAMQLTRVQHASFGDDQLMRGFIQKS